MADAIDRPSELRVNAYDGAGSPVATLTNARFGFKQRAVGPSWFMAPEEPADERDWRHPDVGWGLVLPDRDDLPPAAKARGEDLPDCLRALVADRGGAPILRSRPDLQVSFLRRYYEDGTAQDLSAQAPNPGVAPGRIPQYLLIWASPAQVPWALQYVLNMSNFVGRLDLTGEPLENYVSALLSGFAHQPPDPKAPVLWSVDHGHPDITWLMARGLGAKLKERMTADPDLKDGLRWFGDGGAQIGELAAALSARRPGLVVTTSHGMTGPLGEPEVMRAQLGGLVDDDCKVLTAAELGSWDAYGAIWYAHACCSAGSDTETRYAQLLPAEDPVGRMLAAAAAAAGAMVSPLPQTLLGAPRPLAAFLGHVEPTFDWTLRDPRNGQLLTQMLQRALYNDLYRTGPATPIGLAVARVFRESGAYYAAWRESQIDVNAGIGSAQNWALYNQLVAMDRQTLVIIGDPTVGLPRLSP